MTGRRRCDELCAFITNDEHLVASSHYVPTPLNKLITKLIRQRKVPVKTVRLAPGKQHLESLLVVPTLPLAFCWVFQTDFYDIGFSIRCRETGDSLVTHSRVPVSE